MNDNMLNYQHHLLQASEALRARAATTGAPAYGYGPGAWWANAGWQPPAAPAAAPGLLNDRFVRGLLIGAAAAYLLTNETVQRSAIKGVVRAWGLVQGGMEEVKERFHDAEAEVRAEAE